MIHDGGPSNPDSNLQNDVEWLEIFTISKPECSLDQPAYYNKLKKPEELGKVVAANAWERTLATMPDAIVFNAPSHLARVRRVAVAIGLPSRSSIIDQTQSLRTVKLRTLGVLGWNFERFRGQFHYER
jgi:hypothetical protein